MNKKNARATHNCTDLARFLPRGDGISGVWAISEAHGRMTCRNHFEVVDPTGEYVGNAYFSLTMSKHRPEGFEIRFDQKSLALAVRFDLRSRLRTELKRCKELTEYLKGPEADEVGAADGGGTIPSRPSCSRL